MIRAELERRPLLLLCLGLILGLTLARHPFNLVFLSFAIWPLRDLRARCLVVAGLALGTILGPGTPPPLLKDNQFIDSDWTVATLPKITPYGQRCEIEHGDIRLLLTYNGALDLCPGSTLHVKAVAKPPNEGMDQYFESRNLVGRIYAEGEWVRVVDEAPWIQLLGLNWRMEFLGLAKRNLAPSSAAQVSSICFNADGLLDDSSKAEMQRTGTTHLIVASGLQVLIVGQGLLWILSILPIPRSAQLIIVAGLLALYAIATGLHPSIVRAALMSLLANTAYLVRREPDWASALAAAAIIGLIWKPGSVYEIGFQFSFLTVFFLSMLPARMMWKPGVKEALRRQGWRTMRTSIVAYLIVLPLAAYQFGIVSLVAIPANLLILIAVAPMVMVAMAALLIDPLLPALADAMVHSTQPLATYVESVLHSLGGEGAAFVVPPFSAYWLVLVYGLMLLLWRPYVRQP